jgi:hypothetical protein
MSDVAKLLERLDDFICLNALGKEQIARDAAACIRTLQKKTAWQHCKTHQAIDGARAWGCPDCVAELRQQVRALQSERDARIPHAAVAAMQDGLKAEIRALQVDAVPREPTTAMLQVDVENGAASWLGGKTVMCSGCLLGAVWRAMYDAAAKE